MGNFSRFFIYRPIFALVISIVVVILGALSIPILPIESVPDITPPTVKVSTSYPGADAQIVAETSLEQWRIPQTEIVLAKVKEGDRAGEFLFSPQTVDQLPEFYETIRSLPYKPESWEGVYDFYSTIGRGYPVTRHGSRQSQGQGI